MLILVPRLVYLHASISISSTERQAKLKTASIMDDVALHIKGIVDNLPEQPGCYQFLDAEGRIIYVGKAKRLRSRVRSYFLKDVPSDKTRALVRSICDLKYVVVNSEEDALLLENNLIKQWNPKYNILLKDGKTYPSIVVTKELFPRIFATRRIDKRTGHYFGPYSHQPTINGLLELIKNLYPIRTCKMPISSEGIQEGRYRECLESFIHNCAAPCVSKVSHSDYIGWIHEAIEILKGNTRDIERTLHAQMLQLSDEMRFEEAEVVRRKLVLLANYRSKSEVVSWQINNVDVFNIELDDRTAYINYLHVVNGAITQAFTFEMKAKLDENIEEILVLGIAEMRGRHGSRSRELILPFPVEQSFGDVVVTVPQRGEKRKLLELSRLNVLQYKKDRATQADKLNPEQKGIRLMGELQRVLGLSKLPMRIELFDNSNMQGTDAVAGCVVFVGGKPSKKDYRKYLIRTVEWADDYASMREVVRRRYSRLVEENASLPDLIITDGGRGQMECVRSVVEDELGLSIAIAGLAKDGKHRTHELLYGFPPIAVGTKPDSQLFHLLTRMQDEVHRYAISFHRDKRSKHQVASVLDKIAGIGAQTKDKLLRHFGSVKRIRLASEAQLAEVVGPNKAKILAERLAEESRNN